MASFQLVCCSVLCLIILLQSTQRTVTGYEFFWSDCPADANYTANSPYESNFNLLLSSLSTAAVDTGYYNGSAGAEPNKVYGLAQCRGDQSAAECRSCLSTAAQDIVQKCPMGQNSAIFYEECFLRYSNSSFFYPANSVRNYYIYLCNPQNASNTQVFDDLLGSMMDDLSTRASNSPRKYAGGVATYMSFTNLYGLAQCTRDLSQAACYRCIQDLRGRIPQYCPQRKGGRIYLFDCYIRYELYQFYNNVSTDNPAMPPSLPPRPSPSQESTTTIGNKKFSRGKVLALSISIAVALLVLLLIALFHCRQRTKPDPPGDFPNIRSSEYIIFNFTTLKSATNNFANKLGEGGFGAVYKGMLEDGEQVAVKRLSINSGQGLAEFKTEVALVARLQHRNLVRLLGCCFQEQEKILVYEYLPNTSLDNILFYPSRRSELNWGNRLNIIEGIARGLQYLHEDSRLKIVHRDLKASNILLDANMNPKISDFGLAKLINIDETHRNTSRIAGTYGYMPPEYAMHGNFSVKTDVFSYGVLVLEIVTGRRNSGCDVYSNGSSANLLSYVWQHWNEGRALEVVDQTLTNQYNAEEALRCIHIGLLCIHEDPTYRPSMASVVLMLSSYSLCLPNPSPPAFVFHIGSSHKSDFFHFSGAQGKKKSSEGSTSSVTSREISEDDPIIA